MPQLSVVQLDSTAALRRYGGAWDELWHRATVAAPTARASLVADWCEAFAAGRVFRAFVVEHQGQPVAALPLIGGRVVGMRVGQLPSGCWSAGGDLLLDPAADTRAVCEALLGAVQRTWPMLWLDTVASERADWQALLEVCRQQRLTPFLQPRFTIDKVRITHDWDAYLKTRTRNHRRHVRKGLYAAQRSGALELIRYDALPADEVEGPLRQCFEIEAAGWKAATHGAVLQVPRVWDFYLAQARQLAAWQQLRLTMLTHSRRPIAFEYGWQACGVYGTPKVSYDEAFSRFSPGQLLRFLLFEQLQQDAELEWVDFMGPASNASSRWAMDSYPINRVVVPLRGPVSRLLVTACRQAWPMARHIRRVTRREPQPIAEEVEAG